MLGALLKTYRVASLSKDLDPNTLIKLKAANYPDQLAADAKRRSKAEKDLWDLVANDKELKSVLDKYGTSQDQLTDIFQRLVRCGAGQWVNNQLLCVAVFVYPSTLDYLLRHATDAQLPQAARRLIQYFAEEFETGEPLVD